MASKAKKKKKKKRKPYFGIAVQDAIIEYNNTDSEVKKNKLYNEMIYPALDKLAENVINTWKFHRFETNFMDLKADVVTFCTERLNRYKEGKGKAYSYYTQVSRNFLIKYNKDLYKKRKEKAELPAVDYERDIVNEMSRQKYTEVLEDFVQLWADWIDANIHELFNSNRDKMIATAMADKFRNAEDIPLYNKKAINVLIKEQGVGINTQNITKVTKILKEMFYEQFEYFQKTGYILTEPYI